MSPLAPALYEENEVVNCIGGWTALVAILAVVTAPSAKILVVTELLDKTSFDI